MKVLYAGLAVALIALSGCPNYGGDYFTARANAIKFYQEQDSDEARASWERLDALRPDLSYRECVAPAAIDTEFMVACSPHGHPDRDEHKRVR
jgi:hypothetical protein